MCQVFNLTNQRLRARSLSEEEGLMGMLKVKNEAAGSLADVPCL
jgi:hypothetical protein